MSSDAGPGPGQLLVLSAPSGAGKTTLARRFVERTPGALFSVSATTRAPRGAEREGVDYHFLSEAAFSERIREGAFAEWAEVHGRRYGTLRSSVEAVLRAGGVAVFDIDVQGGAQILDAWPRSTVAVLVVPPSPEELERRLRGRSTDSEETIRGRLAAARAEVAAGAARYPWVLVNDDLEQATARLQAISALERARIEGRRNSEAEAIADRLRRDRVDLSGWAAGGAGIRP
jgi:guanylate kinase